MGQHHTIRVTEALEAYGVKLAEFTADVRVNWHPAYGNNFDEPYEPAHAEFDGVKQVDGPFIKPEALAEWANEWVDANHRRIHEEATGWEPF